VTTLLAKANSFLEHAWSILLRYVLKAPSKPEICFSVLAVQVLRRDLLSATPNLKFLKSSRTGNASSTFSLQALTRRINFIIPLGKEAGQFLCQLKQAVPLP